ncbi:uncharacterized protein LOC143862001 isoform X2 [Tasmannia lanceolata]|uniref:uncharacterized protein LOC143862001 isoform X2 n=1 Tax=Tasmannia lanceolata TaxID=3420 RepID=UPI004063EF5A
MEAFSYQNHSFLPDSIFFPNTTVKMTDLLEGDMNPSTYSYFSSDPPSEISILSATQESGVMDQKQTEDISSMVIEGVDNIPQQQNPMEKGEITNGYHYNSTQPMDTKEAKGRKQKKRNSSSVESEEKKRKCDKNKKKGCEEAPTGYIHVRARRGQATDSHSLAERVRREKISERMKLLQELVPGCEKVTGKALMLDEIINYVQSLQNQVEFLSMKLAFVNPTFYDFSADLEDYLPSSENLGTFQLPLPSAQQSNHTQTAAFADETTIATTKTAFPSTNNYPLLGTSPCLSLHEQMPNTFSQFVR